MAVGIDVGGSTIKCALIDLDTGAFASERFSTPTPAQDSTETLLTALQTVVSNVPGDHAVGLAFPSVIRGGIVHTAANLNKAWIGKPLARLAGERLGRAVMAINDADAAGLAEMRYGTARDVPGPVAAYGLGDGDRSFPPSFLGQQTYPGSKLLWKRPADPLGKPIERPAPRPIA